MTRPVLLDVPADDRVVLEATVAAKTAARRDWQRATIVLMGAEGVSSPKIAEVVDLNRNQVDLWKNRYTEEGLTGLVDRDRSGRPVTYGPHERLTLVKTITTRPVESGQSATRRLKARMSMPEVARILDEEHGIGIGSCQVVVAGWSSSLFGWLAC